MKQINVSNPPLLPREAFSLSPSSYLFQNRSLPRPREPGGHLLANLSAPPTQTWSMAARCHGLRRESAWSLLLSPLSLLLRQCHCHRYCPRFFAFGCLGGL